MENLFQGMNQKMANVLAETTVEGLTPSNIFKHILLDKNEISEYIKNRADIEKIILDFEEQHIKELDKNYQAKMQKLLPLAKKNSEDRYITETGFMVFILNEPKLKKVAAIFNTVIGKYLNPSYVNEDLQGMIPPHPNKEWTQEEKTILDFLGRNLTELAQKGDLQEIVDRDEEIMRLIQILTRQTKSNPVLVGEAGVGKTAIVEKLAFILNQKVGIPSSLHGYKLYELSIPAIVATDDIENTVEEIVKVASREKVVLFLDEVHLIMEQNAKIANLLKPAMARGSFKLIGATTEDEFKSFEKDKAMTRRFQPVKVNAPDKVSVYRILKAKAREAENVHNVLIPDESLLKAISLSERYLPSRQQPDKAIDLLEEASAKLRMILESKPEALIEVENDVSDLEIEMEMIHVRYSSGASEMSERTSEKIEKLKEQHSIKVKEKERLTEHYLKQRELLIAMIAARELVHELTAAKEDALHYGEFETAVDLQTVEIPKAEKILIQTEKDILDFSKTTEENLIQNVVTPEMVSRIIEDQTGIPVSAQGEGDLQKYKTMDVEIKKKVKGQDKPVDEITSAIKRSKAGLSDANKPLGSFLCLGPTGVGKTYLAQIIAQFMFDTDKVLHRYDMSEYMEAHSVARLFGSPPGYVGHDAGGQLTEAIKRNPYSIILFDEIEKAHPRVFDTLLQILDAGRMTDGQGFEVDFKNTIIIMTSNIGSDIIKAGIEREHPTEVIEMALFDEVKNHFRPEFLNRFDAKVMFNALRPVDVVGISENELQKLQEKLLEDNDIELNWHRDLPVYITNEAYDISNGARPIKRFINDVIVNKLTSAILDGSIKKNSIVYVAVDNGLVLFQVDREELKAIKSEEVSEIALNGVVSKTTPKPTKASKKGKKKKIKMTYNLDTENGD